MSKEKNNKKANSKGITLVALVVTIVVLLILAGITITMLFGDNGIIKQAQKAKDLTQQDQANTQQGLQNLVNELNNVVNNYGIAGGSGEDEKWDLNKVSKVEVDGQNIPVPKGYSLSKATGENSVAKGLVLYQDIEGKEGSIENEVNDENVATARTTRNQFVWVPVPDITQMAVLQDGSTTNYRGKLYDFGFNGTTGPAKNLPDVVSYSPNSGYREPAIVDGSSDGTGTQYDGGASNINSVLEEKYKDTTGTKKIQEQFKDQLQAEFNSMVESVKLYKGFYIGRYETGGYSGTTTVVQKGNTDISNKTWYEMYNKSKTIKGENINVTTSIIWGCQWDQVLNWLLKDDTTKGYVTNSDGKGNYGGSIASTGSKTEYGVNNIYDMAGNVWDLTIEANDTNFRVNRRG